MPRHPEHDLQKQCVRWFRLQYPRLAYRLFAVPNGGARSATTGAMLKAEGVLAGVADLVLLCRNRFYGALLIELKTESGRLSPSQRRWQQEVTRTGEYRFVVCRSLDEFIFEVRAYMAHRGCITELPPREEIINDNDN